MAPTQFGIVLPYGEARTAADLAALAEEAGWDGVFVGDAIWCQDPLIQLTAAAMRTSRIRLGTMVLAMPLRDPRHLASESLAIDILSGGRLILGLATGATWMGWGGFPDIPTDAKTRAEMLEESIQILTRMHQRQQFDFDGKHYRVRLSQVDTEHYPPPAVQQPRVPIWIPAVWPRKKNVHRALMVDGIFPQKISPEGQFVDITPEDVRQMKAFLDCERAAAAGASADVPAAAGAAAASRPFDIVVEGKTTGMQPAQAQDTLAPWLEAGATWWIESTWGMPEAELTKRIKQGPPRQI